MRAVFKRATLSPKTLAEPRYNRLPSAELVSLAGSKPSSHFDSATSFSARLLREGAKGVAMRSRKRFVQPIVTALAFLMLIAVFGKTLWFSAPVRAASTAGGPLPGITGSDLTLFNQGVPVFD